MKKLTEAKAWLTIAEARYTPKGESTEQQIIIKGSLRNGGRGWGVCYSINRLTDLGLIDYVTGLKMHSVVSENLPGTEAYFCEYTPANDLLRADFCYLQYYILTYKNRKES